MSSGVQASRRSKALCCLELASEFFLGLFLDPILLHSDDDWIEIGASLNEVLLKLQQGVFQLPDTFNPALLRAREFSSDHIVVRQIHSETRTRFAEDGKGIAALPPVAWRHVQCDEGRAERWIWLFR